MDKDVGFGPRPGEGGCGQQLSAAVCIEEFYHYSCDRKTLVSLRDHTVDYNTFFTEDLYQEGVDGLALLLLCVGQYLFPALSTTDFRGLACFPDKHQLQQVLVDSVFVYRSTPFRVPALTWLEAQAIVCSHTFKNSNRLHH